MTEPLGRRAAGIVLDRYRAALGVPDALAAPSYSIGFDHGHHRGARGPAYPQTAAVRDIGGEDRRVRPALGDDEPGTTQASDRSPRRPSPRSISSPAWQLMFDDPELELALRADRARRPAFRLPRPAAGRRRGERHPDHRQGPGPGGTEIISASVAIADLDRRAVCTATATSSTPGRPRDRLRGTVADARRPVGDDSAAATVPFTREQLVRYAGASGDFNPIHFSDLWARALGLPGVVAHGMLTMGMRCGWSPTGSATRRRSALLGPVHQAGRSCPTTRTAPRSPSGPVESVDGSAVTVGIEAELRRSEGAGCGAGRGRSRTCGRVRPEA